MQQSSVTTKQILAVWASLWHAWHRWLVCGDIWARQEGQDYPVQKVLGWVWRGQTVWWETTSSNLFACSCISNSRSWGRKKKETIYERYRWRKIVRNNHLVQETCVSRITLGFLAWRRLSALVNSCSLLLVTCLTVFVQASGNGANKYKKALAGRHLSNSAVYILFLGYMKVLSHNASRSLMWCMEEAISSYIWSLFMKMTLQRVCATWNQCCMLVGWDFTSPWNNDPLLPTNSGEDNVGFLICSISNWVNPRLF